MNDLHRSAGRACSSGSFWSPDYIGEGSDDPMPGSNQGTTTLSSANGETWSVGSCGS